MRVVVHYAEIGLKGRNRPRFEERLRANLARCLRSLGRPRIRKLYGRILVEMPEGTSFDSVRRRIETVFGVAYFSQVTLTRPSLSEIEEAVDKYVKTRSFKSFGVRARRVDKALPFTSSELAHLLGDRIRQSTGARVELSQPELWIEVHVLSREALLLHGKIAGPRGMPVGTAGHALSLISGGIDSPGAAYQILKRGCALAYVHFHSHPFTNVASQAKVRDIVSSLGKYQGPAHLYMVPFGELQQTLVREAPAAPRIVLYRRFMLRIAEALAAPEQALALVTGESLGQVSSQTLGNLDTINRVATLPVLRPLIGVDKAEIIELAQRIGTYEISIEPDEDCCSYLMPGQPATWTRPEEIEAIERSLDVKGLVEATLARVERERIEPIHE